MKIKFLFYLVFIYFFIINTGSCFAQGQISRPPKHNSTPQKTSSQMSSTTKTTTYKGKENGHDWVDLGLPSGTKWATCNIGTDDFDYYGDFFVWGNPQIITNENIAWNKRPQYYKQDTFRGLINYDPASKLWGSKWQTPSKEQWTELIDSCIFTWTNEYDGGIWVKSKINGQKIYIPACGGCTGTQGYDYPTIVGLYWTSTSAPTENIYGENVKDFAYCFSFDENQENVVRLRFLTDPRQACLSIRPVLNK